MRTQENGLDNTVTYVWKSIANSLDCRVFKLPNGKVGIRAFLPIRIDDKLIRNGENIYLDAKHHISLLNDTMEVVAEYDFHNCNWILFATFLSQLSSDTKSGFLGTALVDENRYLV